VEVTDKLYSYSLNPIKVLDIKISTIVKFLNSASRKGSIVSPVEHTLYFHIM
jgi:hypothetical protein